MDRSSQVSRGHTIQPPRPRLDRRGNAEAPKCRALDDLRPSIPLWIQQRAFERYRDHREQTTRLGSLAVDAEAETRANKKNAGNHSKAVCRVVGVLCSWCLILIVLLFILPKSLTCAGVVASVSDRRRRAFPLCILGATRATVRANSSFYVCRFFRRTLHAHLTHLQPFVSIMRINLTASAVHYDQHRARILIPQRLNHGLRLI